MTTAWYGAESGALGASVVAADNTAHAPASDVGTAAKIYTGASFQYVSDAMHGARAVKLSGSSGGSTYVQLTPTSGWTSRTVAFTLYVKFDTAATQDQTVLFVSQAGQRIMSVTRSGANKWRILSADNTNLWTSTNAIALGSYIRVEGFLKIDSTTGSAGTLNLAIFDGDTDTLLETEQTLTANFGTTAASGILAGKFDSGTYAGGVTLDSYGYNDDATARLGKFPSAVTGDAVPTGAATGGFTRAGSASTDAAALADADDTTYVESGALTSTAQTFRIPVQAMTTRTSLAVTFRLRMGGSGTCTATPRLMQGSTSRGALSPVSVSSSWADYVLTLTSSQAAAITDWLALAVEIDATL